ncbi:putative zinc finger protein [Amylocarpus encephaloides]|uniref:Zinc finger protein n=1 Tax=Amylocarpus encephaloides TaxID=45428 RepID=A0A9P7YCG5_9HELO|nr:putative zinc finger protein [Amylocarpus encephaloides]
MFEERVLQYIRVQFTIPTKDRPSTKPASPRLGQPNSRDQMEEDYGQEEPLCSARRPGLLSSSASCSDPQSQSQQLSTPHQYSFVCDEDRVAVAERAHRQLQSSAASLSSPPQGNRQASAEREQTPSQLLYTPPKRARAVLPDRPLVVVSPSRRRDRYRHQRMDTYPGYREPPLARSPTERTSWSGRDDSYRATDRPESRDKFYRDRSPGVDRRRTRDRSRSPVAVDRYEPSGRQSRDDYDRRDRDRDRENRAPRDREDRRRPSPGPANIDRYVPGQDSGPSITVNPLTDPATLLFQVGFSYFGEWWRTNEKIKEERERARSGRRGEPFRRDTQEDRDKEKARIQLAYDSYKEELQAKMARNFVQEHKGEQWFQERYFAETRDALRLQVNEFRRTNYTQWEQDLESGTFDEYTLEGIPKSESNGAGGVVEKEEGEATATNEVLGIGDLVPSRGSDIRDENAFQPTLLIKTIAPHVSRQNLEAFCSEHLGEDEGGFKWLSLSDPNPSKRYHRIGWVMLHPAPETAPIVDRPELRDEEDGEAPPTPPAVLSAAEKALEAINGKTVKDEARGDFTCHVGVHVPPSLPRKKALWDLFSAPERIEKDLGMAQRLVSKFEEDFGSDFNAVLKIEERVDDLRNSGRLLPPLTSPVVRKVKKSRDSLDLDDAMEDAEEGEEEEEDEEEGALDDEVDDEDLLIKKKQLDLMVEYLRRVFNFCFFCVFESDSIHELTRKCPGGHLRRPRNTLTTSGKAAARASALGQAFPGKKRTESEDTEMGALSPDGDRRFPRSGAASKSEQQLSRAFNWVKTFEDKIKQLLEPESVDIRKLGGKPTEDALQEDLVKYVKQEDEHKFRCRVPECAKLFKEEHFWRKHVEKRHPEWLEGIKKDFDLVNTYVLDPAHIAPSRSDANSNGHFPPANGHMPAGTPRGFNLQQFGIGGMPPIPSFGAPGNFQNFIVGNGMQMPLGWPVGANRGGPDRRGGRQFQGITRTGPYDRRPRDQRWGGENGRLSPPGARRGGATVSSGGRWGDGAAGGAAVGPREAVQGRSLKSYEDLDAVAGGGSGELNY